jgi:hypothetical protein
MGHWSKTEGTCLDSEKFCRAVPVGYAAIRKG